MEDEDMSAAATAQVAPEFDACLVIDPPETPSFEPRPLDVVDVTTRQAKTTPNPQPAEEEATQGPGTETSGAGADDLDDTLDAELIERGRQVIRDILSRPDYLSGTAFADRVRISRQALDKRRKDGTVLGLQGERRGYRYPAWQLLEDPDAPPRIAPALKEALPTLLEVLGGPWAVHSFLLSTHGSLQGRTPIQALRSGDSNSVLEIVEGTRYGGGV